MNIDKSSYFWLKHQIPLTVWAFTRIPFRSTGDILVIFKNIIGILVNFNSETLFQQVRNVLVFFPFSFIENLLNDLID